jgi:hypothetical protein
MISSSCVVKTGTTCAAAAAAASAASLPFAAHACHFLPPPSFRDPSISSVAKTLLSQSLPQQHPPLRLPLTLLHHRSRTGHSSTSLLPRGIELAGISGVLRVRIEPYYHGTLGALKFSEMLKFFEIFFSKNFFFVRKILNVQKILFIEMKMS